MVLALELLRLTYPYYSVLLQMPGCYVLIYVDDLIIMGSSPTELDDLIYSLNHTFALKGLGKLNYFLVVEVSYSETGGLFHSQSKYILDLLHRTKMSEAKPITTHMVSGPILSTHQGEFFMIRIYTGVLWVLLNMPHSHILKLFTVFIRHVNSCTLQLFYIGSLLNIFYDT